MRDPTQGGICHSKKGLLFLEDCGELAVDTCSLCARPVCAAHRVVGPEGPVCPECYYRDQRDASDEDDDTEEDDLDADTDAPLSYPDRDQYYDKYDYQPVVTGSSHYFSDRDYRTFEETTEAPTKGPAATAGEGPEDEEGADREERDDLDHFLES
ncbi:MAG: hypothetical protein HY914_10995 [Desulfomonile tiedjei]|nr:hypothetical protein [Desulfomonile tiedjei]